MRLNGPAGPMHSLRRLLLRDYWWLLLDEAIAKGGGDHAIARRYIFRGYTSRLESSRLIRVANPAPFTNGLEGVSDGLCLRRLGFFDGRFGDHRAGRGQAQGGNICVGIAVHALVRKIAAGNRGGIPHRDLPRLPVDNRVKLMARNGVASAGKWHPDYLPGEVPEQGGLRITDAGGPHQHKGWGGLGGPAHGAIGVAGPGYIGGVVVGGAVEAFEE